MVNLERGLDEGQLAYRLGVEDHIRAAGIHEYLVLDALLPWTMR